VNQIRFFSSDAFDSAPKLKEEANCSALDAMRLL
jgi:hypothetical protein